MKSADIDPLEHVSLEIGIFDLLFRCGLELLKFLITVGRLLMINELEIVHQT